ncbi:histidine kinase HHK3 [Penicillium nucicola]|uniref:histidine kinase HHK3 n=1 Tax=Penicillium nucicola TaxID=1850975 RepID=UPI0025453230|nr:histidine kinase HHK3 [Penicillium nucicola]KAJ5769736.1 histidine kinase HHK3 [Penicillium nucicola]
MDETPYLPGVPYFPKADAPILASSRPSPIRPRIVGPILDPSRFDEPIKPASSEVETSLYPPNPEPYAPSTVSNRPSCFSDPYPRPYLAHNERLRLSMLWYYTRDIEQQSDLLAGLQEKACFAQESIGWEFAVIGIQDVNFYIRLSTVGLPLGILPRGETICAHTVTQPPSSVFLLPNLMEDWRFQQSPYLESGGLRAYAGAPLRLQDESGECVSLGSLCVASSTAQETLTKAQQQTLVRLADWVVSDIVHYAKARRQRERRQMIELLSAIQRDVEAPVSEKAVLEILRVAYPDAVITMQSSKAARIELEGQSSITPSCLENGLWEDTEYIDDFIVNSNNQELPCTRAVRAIAAPCNTVSGSSLLIVASKDFRFIFDDVDSWFLHTTAGIISQMWQKRLLADVMTTKEKFLRGFSHQLRTPLHGILGSVELLTEELSLRETGDASYPGPIASETTQAHPLGPSIHLNTIRTASRDLNAIVNSIITLNRWTDTAMGDRRHFVHTIHELEQGLADEVLKAFSGDTRYNASLIFNHDLPERCDRLRIDLNLLRDSLLPLLLNAIQSTPEGMVVVSVSITPESKSLVVDIKDTGCGIHPDYQQRIFEPYEKAGVHSPGAGLGLTLATKFATLLHGSIELISSSLNHGSHFRATFREVEYLCSNSSAQSLVSRLEHLPSRFHIMAPHADCKSLCNAFANYLLHLGLNDSNIIEDSFAVLQLTPDLAQHRAELSSLSKNRVAICLVPASQKSCVVHMPDNVVYVNGPFLTSTMSQALQDADKLFSRIENSQESRSQNLETLHTPLKSPTEEQIQDRNEGVKPRDVKCSTETWTAQLPLQTTVGFKMSSPSSAQNKAEPRLDSLSHPGILSPVLSPSKKSLKPTALLVDDNAVNLRILEMYCTKRGFSYCCAADGLQAVEIFSQHQSSQASFERPAIQLVVMDLQMPICDGIEATRRIRLLEKRHRWKESAIFIVTGQDGPSDRTEAHGAGADEFFVKPVGIKLLDRSVEQYFPAIDIK